jgi:hypothetical protein
LDHHTPTRSLERVGRCGRVLINLLSDDSEDPLGTDQEV